MQSPSIKNLTSAVFDNGRRGNPRPGCDCEQCFGYCIVDKDKLHRDVHAKFERVGRTPRAGEPLNFDKDAPITLPEAE